MSETKKYICKVEDLDKLLKSAQIEEFKSLFYQSDGTTKREDTWRMFWKGITPKTVLSKFGIDIDHPTVRDAVAFDLIKLDSDDISNDSDYQWEYHIPYSEQEYERMLLNRNFRTNLVFLEPEWSNITYKTGRKETRRTVDWMYQGVRFTENIISYFNDIFEAYMKNVDVNIDNDIYLPFTTGLDISTEIALVPNTHPDFKPISSRAYYDMKYNEYRDLLTQYGINAISTFALVDQKKNKTHTGKYLVKVQKKVADGYVYIVATIDKDGQFQTTDGKLDIKVFKSTKNLILCVCEADYDEPQSESSSSEVWTPVEGDITMVKSTTSSHNSVFMQRIPDYELKYVRNYIQFKNRLEGMELCLEQIRKDVWSKEVQCSQCFIQETLAIWNLFQNFKKSQTQMDYVVQFYEKLKIFDDIAGKLAILENLKDGKKADLDKLVEEYNSLTNSQIDQKIALGEKVQSLRLELDNNYKDAIDNFTDQLDSLEDELSIIRDIVYELKDRIGNPWSEMTDSSLGFNEFQQAFNSNFKIESTKSKFTSESEQIKHDYQVNVSDSESNFSATQSESEQENQEMQDELESSLSQFQSRDLRKCSIEIVSDDIIDTSQFNELQRLTERWRNYMYNLGYELNQYKQILTSAEDATIKVRRLVKNFKDRIMKTDSEVLDANHNFNPNYDATNITQSGIEDIILLLDWYAANADDQTYDELGFESETKFLSFRIKCNERSLYLRKNEYAQSIADEIDRLQNVLNDLSDKIGSKTDQLEYADKYGWEAKKIADENGKAKTTKPSEESRGIKNFDLFVKADEALAESMNLDKKIVAQSRGTSKQDFLKTVSEAGKELDEQVKALKQYEEDSKLMKERTINYLVKIGLIEDESGLEELATRSAAMHFEGDLDSELKKVEYAKTELDDATTNMKRQRTSLQSIIDNVAELEKKSEDMKNEAKRLFNLCIGEKNRQMRNTLLTQKLENETKASEFRQLANKARREHLEDFSSLEKMRNEVDEKQKNYDQVVKTFKETIGLNEETISQLAIKIYNQNQDEILQVN